MASLVSVHCFHGKRRQADCDVFCSAVMRSGIADALPGMRDDGLSRLHIERPFPMCDSQQPLQNDRKLIELGSLAGLDPSLWAAHVSDAGRGGLGVHASNVFVDEFGLIAGGLNAGGLRDQSRHEFGAASGCGFRLRRY